MAQTAQTAPAPQAATLLPPDFRGQVTYSGNYRLKITKPGGGPSSSFQFNNRGAHLNLNVPSDSSKEIAGNIDATAEFSGNQVTLSYRATGGLNPGTISGTRSGDACRFSDGNTEWTTHCGTDGLGGSFTSRQGQNPFLQASFQMRAVKILDRAEQERQQAAAAKADAARKAMKNGTGLPESNPSLSCADKWKRLNADVEKKAQQLARQKRQGITTSDDADSEQKVQQRKDALSAECPLAHP